MVSFKLPLPTSIAVGGGNGGGSTIINDNSSVSVQQIDSGDTNVIVTTDNKTAMIVDYDQNIILGNNSNINSVNSKLTIQSNDNGNCLTFVSSSSPSINTTIALDPLGGLYISNSNGPIHFSNSDIYIDNHNGSTHGLYLGSTLVTATGSELNYVDTIPGTAQQTKALVLDLNKNITSINVLSANQLSGVIMTSYQPNISSVDELNILNTFKLNSNIVSATALQLNYNVVTPGNATSNKSMILDGNKSITGINSLSSVSLSGTILTTSQPNIITVGTLTNLNVNGYVGIGTITPTTNLEISSTSTNATLRISTGNTKTDLYTDISGMLNIVPQGTGILIGSNKNIQLNGTGSITCYGLTASNIIGNIQTAAQPNITSLGTLTNLIVSNSIAIGVTSTSKKLEIRDSISGNCIRISRSDSLYADLVITSGGELSIQNADLKLSTNMSIRLINGDITGVTSITATNISGTLITGAQPNITSLGTLSNLTISGTLNVNTLSVANLAGTLITGAQPNITTIGTLNNLNVNNTITAGTITATTLTGTLQTGSQPNITTIGTLNSLTVTNALSAGSLTATTLTGTLQTGSQPNITAIGVLTSLTVSSSISCGSVSATNLTGTLQTSAQPNITSIGTLSNLSVTGNISSGGNLTANNLTGTLQTASQPNITTIGTLNSLTVTNTITANSLNVSTIIGTLQTSNQPNITSIGTLNRVLTTGFIGIGNNNPTNPIDIITSNGNAFKITYGAYISTININESGDLYIGATSTNKIVLSSGCSIQFSNGGNLIGITNISATNLTGTLQTGAQPNITSIGTLSNLLVTGNIGIGVSSSTYKLNILASDGNCLKIADPNGYTTITSQNGNLYLAPTNKHIYLSTGTNIVLDQGTIEGFSGITFDSIDALITQASQPEITSLGVLTGLEVQGPTLLSNSSGTSLFIDSGDVAINSRVYINGITHLSSSVSIGGDLTTNNIISNGDVTLSSGVLTVSGNSTFQDSVTIANTLTLGTSVLASDDIDKINNITTGTVSASTLFVADTNKDLTGFRNLTATNLCGTIKTAAQSYITSVGTLSSLNVTSYLGVGTTSPTYQIESTASNGKCLKLNNGSNSTTFDVDVSGNLNITTSANNVNIGTSSLTASKLIIGTPGNSTLPLEIGYTSFNFSSAYAYNNSANGHGTIAAGSQLIYNYSIRANGRILCTQSVDITSDRRAKKDIINLTNEFCRKFVLTTQPVKFKWKKGDDQIAYGYIAQELIKYDYGDLIGMEPDEEMEQSIDKETGVVNPAGQRFSVSYNHIIPILAQNQKTLILENQALKNKIDELVILINDLTKKINTN